MKLEIYEALVSAGDQLATRSDLAEAKTEIIKWTVGTMFAAVALFATITRLFP